MSDFRIPDETNRTVIIGETGTGKTVFGVFLLALQNWQEQPWTVLDYKGDELLDKIFKIKHPLIKTLKVGDKPPKKPGLYRLSPSVEIDDEAILKYLWGIYYNQNNGIFIDEGYAVPNEKNCAPLNAIFTQGRARNTPVICCYQRPVFMSRFAIAQASFISVFDQDDDRDLKTTNQFLRPAVGPNGQRIDASTELPKYHSLWYDKGARKTIVLAPSPKPADVVALFKKRLGLAQETRSLGVMV